MFATLISITLFLCKCGVYSQVSPWEIYPDNVNPSAELHQHASSQSAAEHFSHEQ